MIVARQQSVAEGTPAAEAVWERILAQIALDQAHGLTVGQRGRAWDYARPMNEAGAWPDLPAGSRLSLADLFRTFQEAWTAWEAERRPTR